MSGWPAMPPRLEPDGTTSHIDRPTLTAILVKFVPDTKAEDI